VDRLIDAVVVWGDERAIAARVREHLDAGADPGDPRVDDLRRLAVELPV